LVRAEIFVGVAEGDGAGVGDAEQKVGEIVAGRGAGEPKRAAGILLGVVVELLPSVIGAKLDLLASVVPKAVVGQLAGLVAVEGGDPVRKALNAA